MPQTSIDAIIQAGGHSPVVAGFFEAVGGLQMELLLFTVAFCVYALLFGKFGIAKAKVGKKGFKGVTAKDMDGEDFWKSGPKQMRPPPGLTGHASPMQMSALAKEIQGTLRNGSDAATLAAELDSKLGECTPQEALAALADVLESFARTASAELVSAVRQVMTMRKLHLDARLGQVLLRSMFDLRLMDQFQEVFSQADRAGYTSNPNIGLLGLKAALREKDLSLSIECFRKIRCMWQDKTASTAPQTLLQHLVRLAVQQEGLPQTLEELGNVIVSAETLHLMMQECVSNPDLLQMVVKFGHSKRISFSARIYCTLLEGTTSVEEALRLLKECTKLGVATGDVLVSALSFATTHQANSVVEAVVRQLPSNPPSAVAAALIDFHVNTVSKKQDCDTAVLKLFERRFRSVDLSAYVQAARVVADAALRQQRADLLGSVLAALSDSSQQAALIKGHSLTDAKRIFAACPESAARHYNALLEVCIESRDFEAAERVMTDAIKCSAADMVTFNTIVKAHLQAGGLRPARRAMEKMRASGLQPNAVTFNELLDSAIKNSLQDARALVDEMKACGLQPDKITYSILLKGIQPGTRATDVERIMSIMNEMEDEMDEVLFSSVVDACIRVGRGDLLMPLLNKQRSTKRIQVRCAHTYGSMIRAYGHVQDMQGIWDTWHEMKTRNIPPTSITLGSMVEAMVTNGDVDGGYEFVKDVQKDPHCYNLMNAVIYCSLLKGFSHQKRYDQTWAVYQEMRARQFQFSIVTYNTLVDACARSGELSKIPGLLEDMVKQGIEPNLITYSAILKGYCKENKIDKALELLDSMRQSTQYKPDEIMYNTLLDGCARVGMTDRGLTLLDEMQDMGIKPSNFTLSVLVKLASRGRQLDRAFTLCEEISARYHFKLNVHVYTNLVQACIKERELPRALAVLERMGREHVRPDQRTYSLLIRAYAEVGKATDVAGLLRAAAGLEGVHPNLTKFNANLLQPQGRLPDDLVMEGVEAVAACNEGMAVELVRSLKRKMPGLKIDARLKLKMTTRACGAAHR